MLEPPDVGDAEDGGGAGQEGAGDGGACGGAESGRTEHGTMTTALPKAQASTGPKGGTGDNAARFEGLRDLTQQNGECAGIRCLASFHQRWLRV